MYQPVRRTHSCKPKHIGCTEGKSEFRYNVSEKSGAILLRMVDLRGEKDHKSHFVQTLPLPENARIPSAAFLLGHLESRRELTGSSKPGQHRPRSGVGPAFEHQLTGREVLAKRGDLCTLLPLPAQMRTIVTPTLHWWAD